MPDARRVFGNAGERLAERELERRGIRVIERNARTRYGEIDLVCHDGRGYVFVEVKTRREGSFVAAIEAVDARKLQRIGSLAQAWLGVRGQRKSPWRLAVLALTVSSRGTQAELIPVD